MFGGVTLLIAAVFLGPGAAKVELVVCGINDSMSKFVVGGVVLVSHGLVMRGLVLRVCLWSFGGVVLLTDAVSI